MKQLRKYGYIIVCAIMIIMVSCGSPKSTTKDQPSPTTVNLQLAISPAIPASASTQPFPTTAEDSIISALALYRSQGFDAFKSTWLTEDFSNQASYTDFLATTINNVSTTPSALMGWEIIKINPDESGSFPPGTLQSLVKVSFQGGTTMCHWFVLSPPPITGNHWRIANNISTPCEANTSPSAGTTQVAPAVEPTQSRLIWYPCPNMPASGLQVGNNAYVNPVPPLALNVHEGPGEDSPLIAYLNPGEVISIAEGPSCASGRVYWKINFKSVLTQDTNSYEQYAGWVAEMLSGSNYLLLPCPPQGACGGGFNPVRTAFVPPDWLTHRAKP